MSIKKKQYFIVISLILIMTSPIIMARVPLTHAATNVSIQNHAYVEPLPNKVGVGQVVTIIYGINHVHPTTTVNGPFFTGFTLQITDPTGKITTSDVTVDSTSFGTKTFTPDKLGTYNLQLNFGGQWVNLTAGTVTFIFGVIQTDVNLYYEPATSNVTALTVQQEPVAGVPNSPLPTSYWTQAPYNSENKGWAAKLDNWLMLDYDQQPRYFNGMGAFSPITSAPNSAHILWTKPLQEGGLAGALFGDKSLYPSEIYQQYYVPLILNGKIYYLDHGPSNTGIPGSAGATSRNDNFGTSCVDLYTGEQVFYLNNVTIDMAQTLDVEIPNKHGVVPYLWSIPGLSNYNPIGGAPPSTGLTWQMYDASTGNLILTINDAVGGAPLMGPNGEILVYTLGLDGTWLSCWNSTKCILEYDPGGPNLFESPNRGEVLDWNAGLEWNVTLNAPTAIGTPTLMALSYSDNRALVCYGGRLAYPLQTTYPDVLTDCAYPIQIAAGTTTVNPAWVQNRNNIHDFVEAHFNINEGMYSLYDDAERVVYTYDISDGRQISASPALGSSLYTIFAHTWMAYGNTYVWSYDGHVRCVDGKTGKVVWDSYMGDLPFGQAYSTPPVYQGPTIADGKVFIGSSDHSPDSDMWYGSKLFVFDAYTGAPLWNMSGYFSQSAVSDGILTTYNGYNVEITTFGKGPSATTVTAPGVGVTTSTPITISGTVMDMSAGSQQEAVAANFPHGLPCVSDASMPQFMETVYEQQPMPTNITGVPVTINVLDSNGNFRPIGTTTTTASGFFSFNWKPDIAGNYTVTATFAGSQAYYGSSAQTAFYASASAPTQAPTATPLSGLASNTTLVYGIIAIAIIIIVIGAVLAILVTRKRP